MKNYMFLLLSIILPSFLLSGEVNYSVVSALQQTWCNSLSSNADSWYVQFAETEGVDNTKKALESFDKEMRRRVTVVAMESYTYIDENTCGKIWHYCGEGIVPWIDLPEKLHNTSTTPILKLHPNSYFDIQKYDDPIRERADERRRS